MNQVLAALGLVLLLGCGPGTASSRVTLAERGSTPADQIPDDVSPTLPGPAAVLPPEPASLDASQARLYLAQLSPYWVGRELELPELESLEVLQGQAADGLEPILRRWTEEPGFAEAARQLVSLKLSVSGAKDGVDFELPGNLARHVVAQRLPFSTLLTADYCVSADGQRAACDSGAPFTAGVLTTRAFLKSRASRFNLTRAGTLLRVFACRAYPMEDSLQPRLDRASLIPLFQAQTPEEQKDASAQGGFGNGTACYTCHGQFGAHAQLFVRFDEDGLYRANATGLQDPAQEVGRSTNGLMTSHLLDPAQASSNGSQMFGQPVNDLAQAARVMAQSPTFVSCQVRNLLEFAFGLHATSQVEHSVLDDIAAKSTRGGARDPTFADLFVETFLDPRVVRSTLQGLGMETSR